MLLPAPFGPIRPTISPAWTSKLTSSDGYQAAEALRERLTVEQRLAGLRHASRRGSGSAPRAPASTGGGVRQHQRSTNGITPPRANCSTQHEDA